MLSVAQELLSMNTSCNLLAIYCCKFLCDCLDWLVKFSNGCYNMDAGHGLLLNAAVTPLEPTLCASDGRQHMSSGLKSRPGDYKT